MASAMIRKEAYAQQFKMHCQPAYIQVRPSVKNSPTQEPMRVEICRPPPGLCFRTAEQLRDGDLCANWQPVRVEARLALTSASLRSGATGNEQQDKIPVERRSRAGSSDAVFLVAKEKESCAKLHIKHPGCVIHVSEMADLSGHAAPALREHYEQFGEVTDVWLSVVEANPHAAAPQKLQRPSGVALVIMRNKGDANTAIAAGHTQSVSGVEVQVRTFNPKADHPRHQKTWYISEADVEDFKSDYESDEGDTSRTSAGSDITESTAEPGTPTSFTRVVWSF